MFPGTFPGTFIPGNECSQWELLLRGAKITGSEKSLNRINDVNGRFNFMASLARIASDAPNLDCMRKQAYSERSLLQFYNISLPPVSVPSLDGLCMHEASVLLQSSSRACCRRPPIVRSAARSCGLFLVTLLALLLSTAQLQ